MIYFCSNSAFVFFVLPSNLNVLTSFSLLNSDSLVFERVLHSCSCFRVIESLLYLVLFVYLIFKQVPIHQQLLMPGLLTTEEVILIIVLVFKNMENKLITFLQRNFSGINRITKFCVPFCRKFQAFCTKSQKFS